MGRSGGQGRDAGMNAVNPHFHGLHHDPSLIRAHSVGVYIYRYALCFLLDRRQEGFYPLHRHQSTGIFEPQSIGLILLNESFC